LSILNRAVSFALGFDADDGVTGEGGPYRSRSTRVRALPLVLKHILERHAKDARAILNAASRLGE